MAGAFLVYTTVYLFCQISYSLRGELPKILPVLLPFCMNGMLWSVMMNEANISFEEVFFL